MCIASGLGLEIDESKLDDPFGESPGRYLIEIDTQAQSRIQSALAAAGVDLQILGRVTSSATLELGASGSVLIDELIKAWRGTLDW